jgi:hypothetical protein
MRACMAPSATERFLVTLSVEACEPPLEGDTVQARACANAIEQNSVSCVRLPRTPACACCTHTRSTHARCTRRRQPRAAHALLHLR